jgi:hypothetical protein
MKAIGQFRLLLGAVAPDVSQACYSALQARLCSKEKEKQLFRFGG